MTSSFVDNGRRILETSTNMAAVNAQSPNMNMGQRPVSQVYQRSIPQMKTLDVSKSQKNINQIMRQSNQISQASLLSARTRPSEPMDVSRNNLNTINASTDSMKQFGIDGYKLPKHGLPPKHPVFSMPKDKLNNFLAQCQKKAVQIPGPAQYDSPLKWDQNSAVFGRNSKRTTFTDDVIKKSKQFPSSAQYSPLQKSTVILGKQSKAPNFNFLSEAEYIGVSNPSPSSYSPQKSFVQERSPSYKMAKPKDDSVTWKVKKSAEPDVGSYDLSQSMAVTKNRSPTIGFTKSKIVKFTVQSAMNKKHVPGAGQYKIDKAYSMISLPYIKKRY